MIPEPWYTRLVPQLWVIPIIAIVLGKQFTEKGLLSYRLNACIYALIVLLILTSYIGISGASWERFILYLWPIPVVSVVLFKRLFRQRLPYFLANILLVVLISNIFLAWTSNVYLQHARHDSLKAQLEKIAVLSDPTPVTVNFSYFRSNRLRFQEFGVRDLEVARLKCPEPIQVKFSLARVCSNR